MPPHGEARQNRGFRAITDFGGPARLKAKPVLDQNTGTIMHASKLPLRRMKSPSLR
jgi:hypothetical protein